MGEAHRRLMEDLGIQEEQVAGLVKQTLRNLEPFRDILNVCVQDESLLDSALMDAMPPGRKAPEAPALDDGHLLKLIDLLQQENPAYAVLRSPFCNDRVPATVEVSEEVPTAAMDGFGKTHLNPDFLQKALNLIAYKAKYDHYDLGPRAKVLEQHGIPKEYVAVEFILRHEFKHYLRGDLTILYLIRKTKAKKDPAWFTAANVAEDILINHETTKQMGLDPARPPFYGMFSTTHTYETGWTTEKLINEIYRRIKEAQQQQQQQQQQQGEGIG